MGGVGLTDVNCCTVVARRREGRWMAGVWTGRKGLIFDIMAQRIDWERSLEYDGL